MTFWPGDTVLWQGQIGTVASERRWSMFGFVVDVRLGNGVVTPISEAALSGVPANVAMIQRRAPVWGPGQGG